MHLSTFIAVDRLDEDYTKDLFEGGLLVSIMKDFFLAENQTVVIFLSVTKVFGLYHASLSRLV
jgi:hypothetical protein